MTALKAIPTKYAGHTFRSRLEARWALFFDFLHLSWEYEPEGYFLGESPEYDPKLCYLPDFLVKTKQGQDMWVEIKPKNITQDSKFSKFAELLGYSTRSILLSGQPIDVLETHRMCPRCGFFLSLDKYEQSYDEACYCHHCDAETPSGGGHDLRYDGVLSWGYRPHKGDICFSERLPIEFFDAVIHSRAKKCKEHRFYKRPIDY